MGRCRACLPAVVAHAAAAATAGTAGLERAVQQCLAHPLCSSALLIAPSPRKPPTFTNPTPSLSALQVPTRVAVGIKQVPTKVALGVKALADAEEDKSLIVGDVLPKPASE